MADAAPAAPAASGRGRAVAARALTVLALVVALVGGIAFYLERTILDDDGIETIATELIRSDEVRQQVAGTAVEQLYANVDVEQAIAERLPEAQKALAPILAGIARQGAEEAANRLLERPRLQAAWVRVATATQRQLVELLEDEGEFVSTTGGQVTLDLRPIVIDLGEESAVIGLQSSSRSRRVGSRSSTPTSWRPPRRSRVSCACSPTGCGSSPSSWPPSPSGLPAADAASSSGPSQSGSYSSGC
jgi:hypothetical protein